MHDLLTALAAPGCVAGGQSGSARCQVLGFCRLSEQWL